jgi:drug/metabolite transporter (DMT)-like permease
MKWMFLFATITCYPFCSASLMTVDYSAFSAEVYIRIAYVVVLGSFMTYLLIPIGQQTLRPTTLSMYNYLQPVVASFVAVIIGMDTFGIEKTISAVLVFAGVYIVTKSKSRAQVEAELAGNNTLKP